MTDDDRDETRALMREAFEKAFQEQLGHLYRTYITNSLNSPKQAENTKKGIENAVEAYELALSAVDSWEGT